MRWRALEVMSRFAANPKWLIYLPPTMSPTEMTSQPGLLEHPSEAFDYFRREGIALGRMRRKTHGLSRRRDHLPRRRHRAQTIRCDRRRNSESVTRGPDAVSSMTPRLKKNFLKRCALRWTAADSWNQVSNRLGLSRCRVDAVVGEGARTSPPTIRSCGCSGTSIARQKPSLV